MGKRRRGYRRGEHLVQDQESGFVEYASNVGVDYYGVLKRKDQLDSAHPQDFVKALNDPYSVTNVNPPFRDYSQLDSVYGFTIGQTNITSPNPPTSIFRPGIEDAKIEYDFFVY